MNRFHYIFLFCLVGLSISGCGNGATEREGTKLATVFNKSLYLEDLSMAINGLSGKDSVIAVNNFVQSWCRTEVMNHVAEKNIKSDEEVDGLVDAYRTSLIRHRYEQALLQEKLNTTVTDDDLKRYYAENKENYILEEDLIKCHYLRIKRNAPNTEKVKRWWVSSKEEDVDNILAYATEHAELNYLDDTLWLNRTQVLDLLPESSSKERLKAGEIIAKDSEHRHFLKVFQKIDEGDFVPMEYMSDDLKKIVLNVKRRELLESTAEELYERELRRNNIEFYSE